jgi:O-antigen biosynthesis protein
MKRKLRKGKGLLEGYKAGWAKGYLDGRWEAVRQGIVKPRIGYVIPGCSISGGVAVILQHANRLQQRGYHVVLISMDGNTAIGWHPNQVPIVPVTLAPSNLDIVVATFWASLNIARNIRASKRFYFIQSDESRFYPRRSRLAGMAARTYKAKGVTFLTMAGWLQRWLLQRYNRHAFYIPNGLDKELMHRTEPLVPKGKRIRVLLEGPAAIPYKGLKEAFAAVKDLDCEVWCVSSAGVPDPSWRCDRFFGQVPYEEMKKIYSSCDILLKMSRVESFLYPPLEMMACGGIPVVAEVTGTDEYLVHDYNALIIPQDTRAAAQAVRRLISDEGLRSRLLAGGQATFPQWEWNRSIDLLEQAFRNG